MKKNNIGYLLREGIRGLFIHGFRSFTAISVMVACMIIMGSFCLISLNLRNTVNAEENKNRVLVYIDDTYTEAEAKSVGSNINMIGNVSNAEFVSRKQALENYIASQDNPEIYDGLLPDTFRDRFEVSLEDNSLMQQTVDEMKQIPGVAEVAADFEVVEGFQTLQNVLDAVSLTIIVVLLCVSMFIIGNTIKLAMYDRKEEISIMRMVGATNSFIRFPFLVEGFLLGIIGAVVAFFLQWALYDFLQARVQAMDTLQMFEFVSFSEVFAVFAAAYLVVGFLVGVLGSVRSIRKFLQV